jgi:hypothetical protein
VALAEVRRRVAVQPQDLRQRLALFGRTDLYPGAAVACSVIAPIPTEWWLRPESNAARVGEHRAVVWKRLNRRPPAASRRPGQLLQRTQVRGDRRRPDRKVVDDVADDAYIDVEAHLAAAMAPRLIRPRRRAVRILEIGWSWPSRGRRLRATSRQTR